MKHKTLKFTVRRCACGSLMPKNSTECDTCYDMKLNVINEITEAKRVINRRTNQYYGR